MRISEGRKKTVKVCLCLLALMFAMPFISFADGLSMSVTYGYRNTAKSGQLLPVTVEIENDTQEEYDGYAVTEIYGGDGSTLTYTFPSFVVTGSNSFKYTVTIPDGYSSENGDRLRVFFTDDSGEKLAQKDVEVFYHGSGQDVLCGILSENREKLLYLGNVSLGNSLSTKTVTLNPADIPADAEGLSQLDIIVISDFDTRQISDEAAETVIEWVRNGGTLLLGTGGTVSPIGGFSDFIGKISIAPALFRKTDMGMQYSASGPDGACITLPTRRITWEEADESYGQGEVPLFLMRDFGSGRICVASCDFCDLCDFGSGHPEFTEDLLNAVFGNAGLARMKSQSSSAEERLSTSEKLTNTYKKGSRTFKICCGCSHLYTACRRYPLSDPSGKGTRCLLSARSSDPFHVFRSYHLVHFSGYKGHKGLCGIRHIRHASRKRRKTGRGGGSIRLYQDREPGKNCLYASCFIGGCSKARPCKR